MIENKRILEAIKLLVLLQAILAFVEPTTLKSGPSAYNFSFYVIVWSILIHITMDYPLSLYSLI